MFPRAATFAMQPRHSVAQSLSKHLFPSSSSSSSSLYLTASQRSLFHSSPSSRSSILSRSICPHNQKANVVLSANRSALFSNRSSTATTTTQVSASSTATSMSKQHQTLVARHYSSSTSSASTTTATATSIAGSSGSVSSKVPLTFHEEMTQVRYSFNWWKEWTIIMGVFAVTGSSTVMVVRPILKDVFHIEGTMKEGPWSYRATYLCTTLPLYSCVLLTVATLAGRRPYFKKVVLRMWGRFLPKKVIQRFQ